VEEELEQPTSKHTISTFDAPAVLVGVCERAPQDQPQYSVNQLSPQMSEHVCVGISPVMFLIGFLNGVRELLRVN